MRTHVVLPENLVREVDELAGKRKRSRFIAEAVQAKLRHERQKAAFEAARGILRDADYPQWSTPEKTSEWVHEHRRLDDEHRAAKLSAGR